MNHAQGGPHPLLPLHAPRRRAFWSRSPAVTSAGRGPRHHRGLPRHAHDRPTAPTPCSDVHGARPSVLCFRASPMPSLYMPSTRLFGGASNSVTTDNGRHDSQVTNVDVNVYERIAKVPKGFQI